MEYFLSIISAYLVSFLEAERSRLLLLCDAHEESWLLRELQVRGEGAGEDVDGEDPLRYLVSGLHDLLRVSGGGAQYSSQHSHRSGSLVAS